MQHFMHGKPSHKCDFVDLALCTRACSHVCVQSRAGTAQWRTGGWFRRWWWRCWWCCWCRWCLRWTRKHGRATSLYPSVLQHNIRAVSRIRTSKRAQCPCNSGAFGTGYTGHCVGGDAELSERSVRTYGRTNGERTCIGPNKANVHRQLRDMNREPVVCVCFCVQALRRSWMQTRKLGCRTVHGNDNTKLPNMTPLERVPKKPTPSSNV